jgi:hypothetical protein
MKKISAVLLVLVLVGSVVFAGFTGSATTTLGYNLDTGVYGFAYAPATTVELTVLQELGAKKGEGDIYAEINATAKITWDGTGNAIQTSVAIDSAKIISDGWWVSILSAADAADYAVSAIDIDGADDPVTLKTSAAFTKPAGVTIGLDDYTVSLGLTGTAPGVYNVYGTVATPSLDLADGMTAQFAGAGQLSDVGNVVAASAKVAYAGDDASVSAAADLQYAGGVDADVAVKAAFDPVTLDVYFATQTAAAPAMTNLLSAKVGLVVDPVTLTVTGKDLLDAQALSVSAAMQATDDIKVTARGTYNVKAATWEAGADVVRTGATYTGTINATYKSVNELYLKVTYENKTLVDAATLSVCYENANLLANKGAVTAKAVIAF